VTSPTTPHECRLRDLTYAAPINVSVHVDVFYYCNVLIAHFRLTLNTHVDCNELSKLVYASVVCQ
jgi:hypothetical protein